MKFKIGDQVTVVAGATVAGATKTDIGWVPSMDAFYYKTGTIIADYTADPAREFDSWDKNIKRYKVEFTLAQLSDQWWFPETNLNLVTQDRHKHADVIHAWAEGAQVEIKLGSEWVNEIIPDWRLDYEYRIKPAEQNWWENIPEHGILVKSKSSGVICVITQITADGAYNWTPLTNQEIDKFKRIELRSLRDESYKQNSYL